MRFAGIDIAAETHVVAVVDETGAVLVQPLPFTEDVEGYGRVLERLGPASDLLVVMEATGHYWKNLFATLAAHGLAVALINPLRTHRFAQEDLARTKTDAIDALGLARFGAQKRPPATRLPEAATEELRELVRLRDRLVQDFGDRVRQLHRLVDLGFPEFTRYVKGLDTPSTRPPRPSRASRSNAWPGSAMTAATWSAWRWPRPSSRPPGAPSAVTTARPTGSRSATPVRT
jgi:transposase